MERSQLFKEAPFVLKLWFILYCLGISMFFIIFLFMAYIKSRVYIVFVVGCLVASFFPIFPIAKSICHYKTDKKDIFILYVIDVMLFCINIIIIDYILKNNL